MADTPGDMLHMRQMAGFTTELYIPWSELSWRKLLSTLATARYSCPDNAIRLVAQCELSRYVKLLIVNLEAVGQKFSHRPGNPPQLE